MFFLCLHCYTNKLWQITSNTTLMGLMWPLLQCFKPMSYFKCVWTGLSVWQINYLLLLILIYKYSIPSSDFWWQLANFEAGKQFKLSRFNQQPKGRICPFLNFYLAPQGLQNPKLIGVNTMLKMCNTFLSWV